MVKSGKTVTDPVPWRSISLNSPQYEPYGTYQVDRFGF